MRYILAHYRQPQETVNSEHVQMTSCGPLPMSCLDSKTKHSHIVYIFNMANTLNNCQYSVTRHLVKPRGSLMVLYSGQECVG